jgi:HEPN domain-containing protein
MLLALANELQNNGFHYEAASNAHLAYVFLKSTWIGNKKSAILEESIKGILKNLRNSSTITIYENMIMENKSSPVRQYYKFGDAIQEGHGAAVYNIVVK